MIKTIIPLILILFNSCISNEGHTRKEINYGNKSFYSIKVGDTLEIYYSTNSCCKYCSPNLEKLKYLKYLGKKMEIPEEKGCKGCNHTIALLFLAKKSGIDTILGGIIGPLENCNDSILELEKFTVKIR